MIRVELPQHLRALAGVTGEVVLELSGPATPRAVLSSGAEPFLVVGAIAGG